MDYSQVYENLLHFSIEGFQNNLAETSVADLVARHELHHKKITDQSARFSENARTLGKTGSAMA